MTTSLVWNCGQTNEEGFLANTSNALGRTRIETQDNRIPKKVDLSIQEDASVYPALVERSFPCVLAIFLHHFYFPREYETQQIRGNKSVNKNVSRVDSKSARVNCDSQLRVYDNFARIEGEPCSRTSILQY